MKKMIGTTSWLFPGTYYENARLVAQNVDFVELLVYTWDEETQNIIDVEIDKLNNLTEKYGLLYTVHLPTDNIENVFSAYRYFTISKLKIVNYVLHPLEGVETFLSLNGSNMSLENLKEKIIYHEKMTFDVGHHLLGKKFDTGFLKNVNEIHLMGVSQQKDHLRVNEETLIKISKIFGDSIEKIRLWCIEVFDINDMLESLSLVKSFLNRWEIK
ncbi:cobamide remodeling phosphodiesterase CbiR [Pseudothermotoga sp.]|uniref:cobamide remodeling phosphodiesterase CbiR n=1 Tax=Pseudothermotoga sp. TaxID=2033661 RepID=UPI00258CFA9E|nr:cobamide remodeling phosphodiesterase CbiR [Pseudothermotoga sp.]MDK2884394.1 hypothetical protein [Pseudothermotoga sp.]